MASAPSSCAGLAVDQGVDVGRAIALGLELGCLAPPLLAQRWEEGWERPLVPGGKRWASAPWSAAAPLRLHAEDTATGVLA
jgi:hypothetical protein